MNYKAIAIGCGILAFLFISYSLIQNAYENGYDEAYKKARRVGFKEGKTVGWKKGYSEGKVEGEKNTRLILETALKGMPLILADAQLEQEANNQGVIHKLAKVQDGPSIKTIVTNYSGNVNEVIVNRLITFGGFSKAESETIELKFKQTKNVLSDDAYRVYLNNLKEIEDKENTYERAKALAKSISEGACTLMDIFSPLQKFKISKNVLKKGSVRLKNEFNKAGPVINDLAVSYISDQLCVLLVENGLNFLTGSLIDYGTIVNFTEQDFVGQHKMEKVLSLVTAKSNITFTLNRTFERVFAIDPNYSISSNSHVIAGVDLEKRYCVEFYPKSITQSGRTEIVVNLPKPEIISVYPSISPSSINQFWATTLKANEIQTIYREIEYKARREALDKGILATAEQGAIDAIKTLYAPLLLNVNQDYEIIVRFSDTPYNGQEPIAFKG